MQLISTTRTAAHHLVVSTLLFSLAACDDGPVAPRPPAGPDTELLLKSTVSYFADRPWEWQAGDYFHDAEGRLERFEYTSTYTGTPVVTLRNEYLYHDDGRPLGHNGFVYLNEEWHLSSTVRYSYQGDSPFPSAARLDDIDEFTGDVVTQVWDLDYDRYGQLIELRSESMSEILTYDRNGDVVRSRRQGNGSVVLEERLAYTDAWNPYAGLPPLHHAFSAILFPGAYSLHVASTVEVGPVGQPAVTKATATVETNAHSYPTRWELTFWSTNDPEHTTSTVVTEYEYYEP